MAGASISSGANRTDMGTETERETLAPEQANMVLQILLAVAKSNDDIVSKMPAIRGVSQITVPPKQYPAVPENLTGSADLATNITTNNQNNDIVIPIATPDARDPHPEVPPPEVPLPPPATIESPSPEEEQIGEEPSSVVPENSVDLSCRRRRRAYHQLTCPKCNVVYKNFKNISYHMLIKHGKQPKFECLTCQKLFSFYPNLRSHQKATKHRGHSWTMGEPAATTAEPETPSATTITRITRQRRNRLVQQKKPSQPAIRCPCRRCQKGLGKGGIVHHQSIIGDGSFICGHCRKRYASAVGLLSHVGRVHKSKDKEDKKDDTEAPISPIRRGRGRPVTQSAAVELPAESGARRKLIDPSETRCPICLTNTSAPSALVSHLRKWHKLQTVFVCVECRRVCETFLLLRAHRDKDKHAWGYKKLLVPIGEKIPNRLIAASEDDGDEHSENEELPSVGPALEDNLVSGGVRRSTRNHVSPSRWTPGGATRRRLFEIRRSPRATAKTTIDESSSNLIDESSSSRVADHRQPATGDEANSGYDSTSSESSEYSIGRSSHGSEKDYMIPLLTRVDENDDLPAARPPKVSQPDNNAVRLASEEHQIFVKKHEDFFCEECRIEFDDYDPYIVHMFCHGPKMCLGAEITID